MQVKDGTLFHRDPSHHYPTVVRGEGVYLYDDEGNRFIDGTAGAGNVILGHGRRRIVRQDLPDDQPVVETFNGRQVLLD